ncbi:hypothetical protein PVAP13_2KG222788 [Panicum virgatum]|uniref:MINDY deubiquitinase domain-containing protein n=1 Tax=Panicum virgatum TaxID=38727 RepID=A0A8T0WFQ1_PANVG|nr:hypothetical protein PVAP13_2KG222788 [Panicum virgatum]
MKELGEKRKGDREELDDINRAIMLSLGTSDDAIKSLVIVTRFLRGSQLTPHGLESLRKELIEGEPGVLLWNDRLITLTMVGGALYLLVNDLNAVNTRIVWELLNEVNQGGTLMDDKFTAVDSNLNITMLVFFSKIWLQQLEGVAPVGMIVVLLERRAQLE